ncbi:MAG TPA: flagellar export protein FliJ [Succinivibrionaceae bacterium]|nr:flagellar export protein FliJ [Succinivibrionaceae bacterium]
MADDRALTKVLELRKKHEDDERGKWAESLKQIEAFEAQLNRLDAFKKLYLKELAGQQGKDLSVQHYLAYQGFIDRLDTTYERQQKVLEDLKQRSEILRQNYLTARQDRRIIESLLERHRLAAIKAQNKAEARMNDEFVTARQARLLIEQNKQS